MGVWIEICFGFSNSFLADVTPLVGVWIEIQEQPAPLMCGMVTPLVGVWIEIMLGFQWMTLTTSHSPCGSVD